MVTVPTTMSRSPCGGVRRGRSAPNRSMSYGDMDSDMNSIAQQAVAKGYGKIEYLRAQPIARSRRGTTTASAMIALPPDATRGRGRRLVGLGHAFSSIARLPACQSRVAGPPAVEDIPPDGRAHPPPAPPRALRLPRLHGGAGARPAARRVRDRGPGAAPARAGAGGEG